MALEEVEVRAGKDFDVVEELLSHGPFLTGPSPTAADCFLFALLDLVRRPPSPLLQPCVGVILLFSLVSACWQRKQGLVALPSAPSAAACELTN